MDMTGFDIRDNVVFKYVGNDENIVIPEGITSVGHQAFKKNTSLKTIKFPETLSVICSNAFEGCSELENFVIPEKVCIIGENTFKGCKKLTELRISAGVRTIKMSAFNNCTSLTLYIESNPAVSRYAFKQTKQVIAPSLHLSVFDSTEDRKALATGFLNNMQLYKNSDIIEEYKSYIINQRKIFLPEIMEKDNVEALLFYAHAGRIKAGNFDKEYLSVAKEYNATKCIEYLVGWKDKNISLEEIEKEAKKDLFNAADMRKLWGYEILSDGTIAITNYKGNQTEVVIPERIGKKTVSCIDACAFYYCNKKGNFKPPARSAAFSAITSITIPDTVTSIGSKALPYERKFTIYASEGSFAAEYAKKNNIEFAAVD